MTDSKPAYSYLGPPGTFTEAALAQVPEAQGAVWHPVSNVGEALDDVVSGRSVAAMIAIENSIDGGVSVTQDALANIPGLRIRGEYLVPVRFDLVALPGTQLDEIAVIAAHPVAYGQSYTKLNAMLPKHAHLPASSNVAAVAELSTDGPAQAAVGPHGIASRYDVQVLAEDIGENANALTRFVLVGRPGPVPPPTGADKTSLIAELPQDRSGALQELLEQFSTRGVNLSLLASRPIGDALGRYRFIIDADGHILEERVADALLGLKRFSPNVIFLGSYPRADRTPVVVPPQYADEVFIEARDWLRGLIAGEPVTE